VPGQPALEPTELLSEQGSNDNKVPISVSVGGFRIQGKPCLLPLFPASNIATDGALLKFDGPDFVHAGNLKTAGRVKQELAEEGGEEAEAQGEEEEHPKCGKEPCVTISKDLGNYVISGTLHRTMRSVS
jgi:hypothetical protein